MKKYTGLPELFRDFRKLKKLTQVDLSLLLDVDNRTISRWENGESLISPDKEDDICEKMFLPYQVIHNLNSEHPISIFCDIESRTYSFSLYGTKLVDTGLFKSDSLVEEDRIDKLKRSDLKVIQQMKSSRAGDHLVDDSILTRSSELLPELNRVLKDQAGFHGGHVIFIPLKAETYTSIRDKKKEESSIGINDLGEIEDTENCVFYFYSLYSDSMVNAFYLMTKSLRFFKKQRYKNYLVAGKAYRQVALDMHCEMGLKMVWEKEQDNINFPKQYLLDGNYDNYLFGESN